MVVIEEYDLALASLQELQMQFLFKREIGIFDECQAISMLFWEFEFVGYDIAFSEKLKLRISTQRKPIGIRLESLQCFVHKE